MQQSFLSWLLAAAKISHQSLFTLCQAFPPGGTGLVAKNKKIKSQLHVWDLVQGDAFKNGCALLRMGSTSGTSALQNGTFFFFSGSGSGALHSFILLAKNLCRATSLFHIIWKLWAVTEWRERQSKERNVQLADAQLYVENVICSWVLKYLLKIHTHRWTCSLSPHTSSTHEQEHIPKVAPISQNKTCIFL